MNVEQLRAIDVYVHVEADARGRQSLILKDNALRTLGLE